MEGSSTTQNVYNLAVKTLFELSETVSARCLCVLPFEKNKKTQRFVVGSQNHIEIWECKKGEM